MPYTSDFLTGGSITSDLISPGNLNDNNNSTYCYDPSHGTKYWIYDLGSGVTKKARRIALLSKQVDATSYGIKDFVLYGSNNGYDWTTLRSGQQLNNGDWQYYDFANAVYYRYYKILFIGSWYNDISVWASEAELHEMTGDADGDIFSSGYPYGGMASPENACDNNESTKYGQATAQGNQWWAYDAVDSKVMRRLRMKAAPVNTGAYGIKNFTLYGSNNYSDWYIIYAGTQANNGNWQEYIFNNNATPYRYYKIDFRGGCYYSVDWIYVYEIEAFETPLPPSTPSAPSGPAVGAPSVSYNFSSTATDPDNDQIYYVFDWGDTTTSQSSLVSSGTEVTLAHSWTAAGTFQIKVQAFDSGGLSSGWSSTATIVIAAPGSYARVVGLW